MKKNLNSRKIFFRITDFVRVFVFLVALFLIIAPNFSYAQTPNPAGPSSNPSGGSPNPQTNPSNATITINSNLPNNAGDKLYNPLPEEELTHVFLVVVQGFLGIVGIWAVMFIIVGGFEMVTAAGNEEMLTKAKKTIVWAVLGLVAALMSFSIIAIVENIFKAQIQPLSTTTTTPPATQVTTPPATSGK